MKKKALLSFLLAAALMSQAAFGAEISKVSIGDFDYLLLRDAVTGLGAQVTYDAGTRSVIIAGRDASISKYYLDSSMGEYKGTPIVLNGETTIREGRLYISIKGLSQLMGTNLEYKEGVLKPKAAASAGSSYTVEQLAKLAIDKDKALRKAGLSADKAKDTAENSKGSIEYYPTGTGSTYLEASNAAKMIGFESAQIAQDLAERDIKTTEDEVRYSVIAGAENILQLQDAIALLKRTVEVDEKELAINRLKHDQGLLSDTALNKDKLESDSLKAKLAAKEGDLKIAYDKMNTLTDIKNGSSYPIDPSFITYKPLGNLNPATEAARVINASPTLYALTKQIEIAKLGKQFYVYNYTSDSYTAKGISIAIAELDYNSAKAATEKAIYDCVNKSKQLSSLRESLNADLEKALQDQSNAALSYKVGMIAKLDLEKTELAVLDLKNQLLNNTIQYNTLSRTIEKPWISVN